MSVFEPLVNLTSLTVAFTGIDEIVSAYLPSLKELVLYSNHLYDMPRTCGENGTSLYPNLATLDLSANNLQSLEYLPVCLPRLTLLDVSRNMFWDHPFLRRQRGSGRHASFSELTRDQISTQRFEV